MRYLLKINPIDDTPGGGTEHRWFTRTLSGNGVYEDSRVDGNKVIFYRNDFLDIEVDYGCCQYANGTLVDASIYQNLCLGMSTEYNMLHTADLLTMTAPETSLLIGISTSESANPEDYFDCFYGPETPVECGTGERNMIQNATMRFYPGDLAQELVNSGDDFFKLCFCFGDPHSDEIDINVGKE